MKKLAWLVVLGGAIAAVLSQLHLDPLPCLLGRHDGVLVFGEGEIFLRCTNCLRRSEGWDLGARVTK